jgi:hypothetical protein
MKLLCESMQTTKEDRRSNSGRSRVLDDQLIGRQSKDELRSGQLEDSVARFLGQAVNSVEEKQCLGGWSKASSAQTF